ncbi:hypothetical protein RCO27_16205 [Sphingosinicella sp. LHD-64]|uniref:hypothetical protein n=1 Tax=Sphingosinicella sp. LHD-64 TaxID=3072139 RepID=UPI00280DC829|nr:hypothetical protein [Sphingosinicella sp. LHD-64]MDQ8757770.1 hypothetical protein [Sphingosinicella sp. LHD-64]
MKSALFAAALMIGGAAFAQGTTPPAPATTSPPAETAPPASGQTVAPGNQAPARDARGIPVVSDPATAPPGFNQPPQPGGTGASPAAAPTPQPDTGPKPNCSRTVTDNCLQAYERGRSPQ